MKSVWKYPLTSEDIITLSLPRESEPLSVQEQGGIPCMWVLVNPDESIYENRSFRFAGTGHLIQEAQLKFIGTFQLFDGSFVGHLFEIL